MTRAQWGLWLAGLLASLAVLGVFTVLKGGPDWYFLVFLAASGYCLVAGSLELYLRRTRPAITHLEGWLSALSTARLGLVGVAAVAVVLAILLLFRSRLL